MEDEDVIFKKIHQELGDRVVIVVDEQPILDWVVDNLPFPPSGGTVDWAGVPASKWLSVNPREVEALSAVFEVLVEHVGARDSDNVFVFWQRPGLPMLAMRLADCRLILGWVAEVHGEELNIVCPDSRWYLEIDSYLREANGARVT
ncbi:MAG: hypothetical protein M3441_02985 [Chloroflexota bacterium]|nr:hypothetical protein [Chloroflexota bacterium]